MAIIDRKYCEEDKFLHEMQPGDVVYSDAFYDFTVDQDYQVWIDKETPYMTRMPTAQDRDVYLPGWMKVEKLEDGEFSLTIYLSKRKHIYRSFLDSDDWQKYTKVKEVSVVETEDENE